MNNPTDAARDSVLTEFDVNPHFTDCGCSVCVASRRLADEIVRLRQVLSNIGYLHKTDLEARQANAKTWKDALFEANGLLRSCCEVALVNYRANANPSLTNWEGLYKKLTEILNKQHRLMYPEQYEKKDDV